MEIKATVMQRLKTAPGGEVTISNSVSFNLQEDLDMIDKFDKILNEKIFDENGNIINPAKLLLLPTKLAFFTREQQRKMLCDMNPEEFILPDVQ